MKLKNKERKRKKRIKCWNSYEEKAINLLPRGKNYRKNYLHLQRWVCMILLFYLIFSNQKRIKFRLVLSRFTSKNLLLDFDICRFVWWKFLELPMGKNGCVFCWIKNILNVNFLTYHLILMVQTKNVKIKKKKITEKNFSQQFYNIHSICCVKYRRHTFVVIPHTLLWGYTIAFYPRLS